MTLSPSINNPSLVINKCELWNSSKTKEYLPKSITSIFKNNLLILKINKDNKTKEKTQIRIFLSIKTTL